MSGKQRGKQKSGLTPLVISRDMMPGRYGDGGGLYLLVGPTGTKSWVFRYKVQKVERGMGLGAFPTVSLAAARAKAAECRRMRADGKDPLAIQAAERERERLEAARAVTFKQCCQTYIATHEAGWRNAKHRQQWRNTLATYAYPALGELPVKEVRTEDITKILAPLWSQKPETASRLRNRIELVLDWATVMHYREGENPARWRGHLDKVFPKKSRVRRVKHHAALPYTEIPQFMADLRAIEHLSARALEFVILTAARTSAVTGAALDEVNEIARLWTVPGDRAGTKLSQDFHRVPLSVRALEIVRELSVLGSRRLVFPGRKKDRPMSNMTMLELLRALRPGLTVHGFRSTFKDWAAETTDFPDIVSEMALAHVIDDDVQAAYRRGELLEKRRRLMDAWAEYCAMPADVAAASARAREA